MRKALLIFLAAAVLIAVPWLAGCGTQVKINTKTGKLEVSSPKGSLKIETKTPTEAELGVPIYPNAKAVESGSISLTEGQSTTSAAVPFVTDDSVSKVLTWYKEKLAGKPGLKDMTAAEGGIMTFQSGDQIKMVIIGPSTSAESKGKTVIEIGSGSGNMLQQSQ